MALIFTLASYDFHSCGMFLAAASDKVYHLLAHGWWFSPGTLASSTTKTGRHDIAEILLKVALNTKNQIKSTNCRPDNRVVFKILNTDHGQATGKLYHLHPFLQCTKQGANPRRIGDRLV
jgi:hypothetical protein